MNRCASAAMAAVTIAFACDRGISPTLAMNATFDLRSINGRSLPYDTTRGTARLHITSDVLVLRDDGAYEDSTTYAFSANRTRQVSTAIERGRYGASGSSIWFVDQTHGDRYVGSLRGGTLTHSVNGNTSRYERR